MKHIRIIGIFIVTALVLPALLLASCTPEPEIRNDVLDSGTVIPAASVDKALLTYVKTESVGMPDYTASYTEPEDMPAPTFTRNWKYDIYTDADGVTYRYFAGTDFLCGVMAPAPEKTGDTLLSINATRAAADTYLAGLLTTAGGYEYLSRYYDEETGLHSIQYSYRVQRVDTNDIVAIAITDDCEIIGWSAFNLGDYYGIVLDSDLLADSIAVMKSNSAGVDLTFIGLTYDTNGVLCCTFTVDLKTYAVPLLR